MKLLSNLFTSTLGRKYIMAGSGAVLGLFVVGHLIGNLQIFLPPAAINRYAHFLQSLGEVLWGIRLFMLTTIGLHIWAAISLTLENRAARPERYGSGYAPYAASLASRTMLISGLGVAAFLIYHLLHFTVRLEDINGTAILIRQLKDPVTGYPDCYAMMVAGFSVVPVSLFYLVGVGLLCFHLSHGIQAMFQSLGLRNPAYAPLITKAAKGIALVLFLGYAAIPTSVFVFGHGKAYLQEVINAAPPAAAVAAAGKDLVK
ncbi:MAG TPA: succinate dehydrogenase cytochrome b subunit [Verrucomicrobiota bacterium]|jgi:succinate dehydrogenase / fumarate reductase cytochrome b subunit|nr:succinate dehydrogenase cytochrome b subunit [Verrucomicrobiota bacterium]OQB93546.1 MAG: Succinate dehydrogenase/Fumarate reductase transmembrane subunit [Verrucomicrobia bacterium ADurb.Bin118]HPY30141.1 succinate dehydrogenase cytochrome b subunit [Verrucomicrobiota bacterium]HQB16725.1 succinate dehydrogenase cytochrome b subunit [Verrucomicrobiota bacterium]